MVIPAFLVGGLIEDRSHRSEEVIREISSHVGGQQSFLGPTLAIPYTQSKSLAASARRGMYLVFPVRASATLKVDTQERRRSLFKVPVFQVDGKLDATFDLQRTPSSLPQGAELDWANAEILVGVSDARGALSDATVTFAGKTVTLVPAEIAQYLSIGADPSSPFRLTLFGTKAGVMAKPDAQFSLSSSLRFSGAQRVAVLAYGKTTDLTVQGDWPSPGFDGGFLPRERSVAPTGFSADWSVPFIARGVRAEGQSESITGLDATSLGVSFIEVADPYQSVNRSLKYVPLFLGLVFLSYFMFEVSSAKRVHPAQYVLIGLAQIIFYLLLLSVAERIGFDLGFLIASAATVLLLSANALWIFASRLEGARALLVFSLLYALIYMLLRLEDNALLVGAITSFLAVAAAMYYTRRIDWYSSFAGSSARKVAGAPPLEEA
jgi:inner membrane protein